MITFKSAGHALATFFKAAVAEVKKYTPIVQSDIATVESSKPVVEGVTGAILAVVNPGAAATAVGIEDAAYAVLGEITALITAGGAAAEKKLLDAGLDENVVTAAKSVAAGASQVGTLIQAKIK